MNSLIQMPNNAKVIQEAEVNLLTDLIIETKVLWQEFNIKHDIKVIWKNMMKHMFPPDKDKPLQPQDLYSIYDIRIRKYGFDMLINIPNGKNLADFRKLIPSISQMYKAEVISEYTTNFARILLRARIRELPISVKDNIRFKWYRIFSEKQFRADTSETFTIETIESIISPNNKEEIGYSLIVSIPAGLSKNNLEACKDMIESQFGRVYMKWDDEIMRMRIDVVAKVLDDNEKFNIIKTKPYELYVGMTYAYKPVILDFSKDPNAIFGGKSGSGKTMGMLTALVNLCNQYGKNTIRLFPAMLSDKQDLRIFKNLEQCDYYADNIDKAIRMFKYLSNECSRRNRLFEEADAQGRIVNIYDYNKNKTNKKNKLPLIYVLLDEVASLSINGSEVNEQEENDKILCGSLMWKLAREGRSAGIYIVMASQRGDVRNLDANIKANLGNQISFYFSNMPSAQTILGDSQLATETLKLKKSREFIANANEIYRGQTLKLTLDDCINYLSKYHQPDKKHLDIDRNGRVFDKKIQKNIKNTSKSIDFTENVDKINQESSKKNQNKINAKRRFFSKKKGE